MGLMLRLMKEADWILVLWLVEVNLSLDFGDLSRRFYFLFGFCILKAIS